MTSLVAISSELSARVEALAFPSVPYLYNPLVYAWAPQPGHEEFFGEFVEAMRTATLVG